MQLDHSQTQFCSLFSIFSPKGFLSNTFLMSIRTKLLSMKSIYELFINVEGLVSMSDYGNDN